MTLVLALVALAFALLPAILACANLIALRTPEPEAAQDGLVSILIPARDEEGTIVETVRAALASTGIAVEVLVGDDHSTDATAALQSAGHGGLRTYLSGSATNAPVLGLFDDLVAGPA